MAATQTVGVTYTGAETPFVDRIYRSRLTFEPGQTRDVPSDLAAKFLRHADVFKEPDAPAPEKKGNKSQDKTDKTDDTAATLEQAKKDEEERRKKEDQRFQLHQQIDKMDKQAVRDWVKTKFQQELPNNLGVEKTRDRAKGLVDQFGVA